MKKIKHRPIKTVSLLARGKSGLAAAEMLSKDRGVSVVSYWDGETSARRSPLRRFFPAALRVTDPAGAAYAAHCRQSVDCILSVHCNVIIPPEVLESARDAFNLHPGYLPYGRGYWPTYWAIPDRSTAGATLHRMVAKVDRGAIVAQRRVKVEPTDTGEALTLRINEAEIALLREIWPRLRSGSYSEKMARGRGNYHNRAQGIAVRELDLDAKTTARVVIDKLRAFTDSRFDGCYFIAGGRKIYLRLTLYEAGRTGRNR
jgi:methionyl-tRNA formyltransferase